MKKILLVALLTACSVFGFMASQQEAEAGCASGSTARCLLNSTAGDGYKCVSGTGLPSNCSQGGGGGGVVPLPSPM